MASVLGASAVQRLKLSAVCIGAVWVPVAALAGGTVPPPPPPQGSISMSADGYDIAPSTVSFSDSSETIPLSSIAEIDWNFSPSNTNINGYIVGQYGNYIIAPYFLQLLPCSRLGSLCSQKQISGWVDDQSGNGVKYNTQNPFSVAFHYNVPGSYNVTLTIIDTSNNSYQLSATAVVGAPPAPSDISKTGGGVEYVTFAWTPVLGVDGYNIQMQSDNGCLLSYWSGSGLVIGSKQWGNVAVTQSTTDSTKVTTTINDAMLCDGSQYQVQIQSFKGGNVGPWSNLTSGFYLP